jgi:hypothetical protein
MKRVLSQLVLLMFLANTALAAELEWTIAPYLWVSDVAMDLTINGEPALGTSVPFKDLIDKLDTAFMGHAEARGDRFGGFFDMIYIDLSDGQTIPVGPGGPILGDLVVDAELKLELYELGGLYRIGRPEPGKAEFDILLGVRQIDMGMNLNITLPGPAGTQLSPRIDASKTDIFAGVRVIGKFNERWGYKAKADLGGGGSDGTLNLLATVGYTFGQTGLFSLDLGYRYMTIELSNSEGGGVTTESEITLSGPLIGFIFNF